MQRPHKYKWIVSYCDGTKEFRSLTLAQAFIKQLKRFNHVASVKRTWK